MCYVIHEADLELERDAILEFWRDNHPRSLEKKFHWMYQSNPAGKARVWMVKHLESGEFVGMVALFPRRFKVGIEVRKAGIMGDFLVSKRHRIMGPAIMLQKSVISSVNEDDFDFAYGYPNKKADVIQRRAGWKSLGTTTRFVKIIRSSDLLRRKGVPEYLVALVGPIFDSMLRLMSLETWCPRMDGLACQELYEVDERFDHFWEHNKSDFAFAGERTAEYLRWRFLEDPVFTNKIYAALTPDNSMLKGYIIYRFHESSVEIIDMASIYQEEIFSVLMANFLKYLKMLDCESVVISCLENIKLSKFITKFNFRKRSNENNINIFIDKLESNVDYFKIQAGVHMLMIGDFDI